VIRTVRSRIAQRRHLLHDLRAIRRVEGVSCECGRLVQGVTKDDLSRAFRNEHVDDEWRAIEQEIGGLEITSKAGGVNPGDRRAIYYLVRHFQPRAVLEIGTHIGASTVHIAAALRKAQQDDPPASYGLTTVDVADVNDPSTTPWLQYGSTYSPAEMVARLGYENHVSFITGRSLDYLASCEEQYDFIFLDGDHAAQTVYAEVPAALRVLRARGVVLLHDYFPGLRPLWSDGSVIPGPWLATKRLHSDDARFEIIPLGELPWPTKLGSSTTSLALLVGA
jgi:predicted O-methyltransferase YrrM